MICQGCGGIIGRDCYNENECMQIAATMRQQGEQEIWDLCNELSIRNDRINLLEEVVREFLKVINRSPAALHHYADAIKLGEDALIVPVVEPINEPPEDPFGLPF